jgi:predicted  nucleic acid-binding Zn-ribbon protein
MISDLELLIKLQEIDLKISELVHAQEKFPSTISAYSGTIKTASDSVDNISKRIADVVSEKKSTEEKISDARIQLDKSQERLNTIKTNREYDAVHTQIENFKNTLTSGDSKLKTLIQEAELLQQSLEKETAELEKIKSENEPHIAEIKGKIDTLGVSIAELTAQRNEIIAMVPKAVLRTYDYILKRRKNGQVLSFVKGNARTCSICFKILEPQLINEIRKGNKMIVCQNCGSVFIWKNEDLKEA